MTEIVSMTEEPANGGGVQPDTDAFRFDQLVPGAPLDEKEAERVALFFGKDRAPSEDKEMTEIVSDTEEPVPADKLQQPDAEAFRLDRLVPGAPVDERATERVIALFGSAADETAPSKEQAMTQIISPMEEPVRDAKAQQPDEAFKLDRPVSGAPADERETERVTVFGALVTADDDIVGLVAYSIFKQHENDWLVAFNERKGREPSEAELAAFIIGEGTARRLANYRHLAEATLAGHGPKVPPGSSTTTFVQRSYAAAARHAPPVAPRPARPARSNSLIYIALAVIVVCGALLATRLGLIRL